MVFVPLILASFGLRKDKRMEYFLPLLPESFGKRSGEELGFASYCKLSTYSPFHLRRPNTQYHQLLAPLLQP